MARTLGTTGKPRRSSASPPARLRGPGGEAYLLRRGWTAQHGGRAARAGTAPTLVMEEGRVRLYDREPPPASGAAQGPVYATAAGDPAVPTGTVFVRFAPRVRAERRRADLEAAGFSVESVPALAPNAAWVRAGGGIAAALRGLARLRKLPGVEAVEPEVLLVRARR